MHNEHYSRVRRTLSCALLGAVAILGTAVHVGATTFTIKNNCSYTVYPGIYPAVYDNGGWSMASGASVSFNPGTAFNGRIWGRQGCNTASPAVCSSGSCGGTGLECAGTTGVAGTSLAEFNLDAAAGGECGAGEPCDWYDISYVDGQDTPLGIVISTTSCVSPNTCTKISCPDTVLNGVDCLSPCTAYGGAQYCCSGGDDTSATCDEAAWPAPGSTYVSDLHSSCPHDYAYAYDDNVGLQTCDNGDNYTISFCPNGTGSTSGSTSTSSSSSSSSSSSTSTTTGGTYNGTWQLTPENNTALRLDVAGNGTANGTLLQAYTSNGTTAQSFVFSNSGVTPSGDYNFVKSGGAYCVQAAGTTSGSSVEIYACAGTAAQSWKITADSSPSGYYQLSPSSAGTLVLDNTGTTSGSKVEVVTSNSGTAQQWSGL